MVGSNNKKSEQRSKSKEGRHERGRKSYWRCVDCGVVWGGWTVQCTGGSNSGWIWTYLSEGGIVSVWMNDQSLESPDCVSCLATLTTDWEILSPVLSHPVRLLEDVSRWVSWECLWIICLEVRSTHSHCLAEFWELVLCGSCGIIIVILSTHICVNYEKTSEEERWKQ